MEEPTSEREVVNMFQNLRQEVQTEWSKISELENQRGEHNLVIGERDFNGVGACVCVSIPDQLPRGAIR